MPLYEYSCSQCDKTFEMIQKFSDPPEASCPGCGLECRRLVSRTSFQLKGTGWYASDYKKPSAKTETSVAGAGTSTATPPKTKTE